LVFAFAIALTAFRAGVGVSDRVGVANADLLTHIYYSLGLFVLGGMDLGIPRGGPVMARALLWVAYFLAPLITTSAVLEGALRLLRPEWLQRRGLSDHVVVVGAGRLGMIFLDALHELAPDRRVLVVDMDANRANVRQAQDRYGARFLAGDIRNAATLDSLGLETARLVVLLTDEDLVNLDAAWRIVERAPRAQVVAHVADLGMRRTVERVRLANRGRLHLFNSHQIAARRLHDDHLRDHFAETAPADVVVLAGFGRFGQTILEHLQEEAEGEIERAVIIDVAGERQARLFKAQVPGFDACELVVIPSDLDDPATWQRVEEATSVYDVEPVFVVGTDDDQVNVRTAIALRSTHPKARIFVRCVYRSSFTSEIAKELDLEILAVETMLRDALFREQRTWLESAE
jgi:Trk K+ transport system NAD-binding subunit